MSLKSHTSVLLQGARFALASLALLQFSVLGPLTSPAQAQEMHRQVGQAFSLEQMGAKVLRLYRDLLGCAD